MTRTLDRLERKTAVVVPGTADVDPDTGEVVALAAVTGGRPDEVGDIIVPGALAKSLRRRTPRLCVGHDWARLAGRVTEARELMPGDPRLPRTAPDGTPWPDDTGALWFRARFLPTHDGREARAVAQAFDTDHAYSIGYTVAADGAKVRSGIRYISDLDVFEISAVLHGAHRLATQLSVKSAAGALRTAVQPLACGGCGRTAGGTTGSVPADSVWLCPSCCGEVTALTGYLARTAPETLADTVTAVDDDATDDGGGDVLPDLDDLYAEPADEDQAADDDPDDDAQDPLVTPVPCALCGAGLGQLGDVPADHDVICADCLNEITKLSDQLADDAEDGPTAGQEYEDAVTAEIPWQMLADGTLAVEGTGAGGIGPRAWGLHAGGRARP